MRLIGASFMRDWHLIGDSCFGATIAESHLSRGGDNYAGLDADRDNYS
jgi:hypothetical protein